VTHNRLDLLFELGRLCGLFRFLDHGFTPWCGVLDYCWIVIRPTDLMMSAQWWDDSTL
jgi:hypothetical protein